MTLYVDTSAFVKIFVDEAHSLRIRQHVDQVELLGTSTLTYVETLSALARSGREKRLTIENRQRAIDQLNERWLSCSLIPVTDALIATAGQLVLNYPLKAYDAIQLASALDFQDQLKRPITFAAFDQTLNRAAKKESLTLLKG